MQIMTITRTSCKPSWSESRHSIVTYFLTQYDVCMSWIYSRFCFLFNDISPTVTCLTLFYIKFISCHLPHLGEGWGRATYQVCKARLKLNHGCLAPNYTVASYSFWKLVVGSSSFNRLILSNFIVPAGQPFWAQVTCWSFGCWGLDSL